MLKIDYRAFAQDNFFVKNKAGILVPLVFNEVQNYYYDMLLTEYNGMLWGIRENILKGRQFGLSTEITAIIASHYILAELGEVPILDSDVYSHKDEETQAHIDRFNLFVNSWLIRDQGGGIEDMENTEAIRKLRKGFLNIDNGGEIVGRKRGSQYHAQTASAKVSGRGGTKQIVHFTEPAHYPNTEIMDAKKLVTGVEKQVPLGQGMIFRETTGNTSVDFFAEEWARADEGRGFFRNRFIAWYLHKEYQMLAPTEWEPPEYYRQLINQGLADKNQCFWHWKQTDGLKDKIELREYPTYEHEAFLMGGAFFFDRDALIAYKNQEKQPVKEAEFIGGVI